MSGFRKDYEALCNYVNVEWIGENIETNIFRTKAALEAIPGIVFS